MRPIITNFNELAKHLMSTGGSKKLIVETINYKDNQEDTESIFIGDTPEGGLINIKKEHKYLDDIDMEISHNYAGEFNFKRINLREVIYLLTREQVL